MVVVTSSSIGKKGMAASVTYDPEADAPKPQIPARIGPAEFGELKTERRLSSGRSGKTPGV